MEKRIKFYVMLILILILNVKACGHNTDPYWCKGPCQEGWVCQGAGTGCNCVRRSSEIKILISEPEPEKRKMECIPNFHPFANLNIVVLNFVNQTCV